MPRSPVRIEKSSGNVFLDIGFDPAEAAELLAKAKLSLALKRAIAARGLTQKQAAALCGTDQPTLSKVLSGRMTSISLDQLARGLNALGRTVEIRIKRGRGPATTVVVGTQRGASCHVLRMMRMMRVMRRRGLTQARAVKLMGIKQPDISNLVRGRFRGYSIEHLLAQLQARDQDIEIVMRDKPKSRHPARLVVRSAA